MIRANVGAWKRSWFSMAMTIPLRSNSGITSWISETTSSLIRLVVPLVDHDAHDLRSEAHGQVEIGQQVVRCDPTRADLDLDAELPRALVQCVKLESAQRVQRQVVANLHEPDAQFRRSLDQPNRRHRLRRLTPRHPNRPCVSV